MLLATRLCSTAEGTLQGHGPVPSARGSDRPSDSQRRAAMAVLARHLLAFALMGALMSSALANGDEDDDGEGPLEVSTGINCEDGLVVPLWPVGDGLAPGDRFGRGLLYATLMLYLFIGVAIVSDKFMESIEMITAQEKEMSITNP